MATLAILASLPLATDEFQATAREFLGQCSLARYMVGITQFAAERIAGRQVGCAVTLVALKKLSQGFAGYAHAQNEPRLGIDVVVRFQVGLDQVFGIGRLTKNPPF